MGGVARWTGSIECRLPLQCAWAVLIQPRDDRQVQVFSFNRLDEHAPFTLRISLDHLANADVTTLVQELADPGRFWAASVIGALHVMGTQGLIDLRSVSARGLNLAMLSDIPPGAGLGASSAQCVAVTKALADALGIGLDVNRLTTFCQQVAGVVQPDHHDWVEMLTSASNQPGVLKCGLHQPGLVQPDRPMPEGIRVVGIDTGVRAPDATRRRTIAKIAARMAHALILEKMRQLGTAAGMTLIGDPMRGYLANLDPNDFKKLFRNYLPEWIKGGEFLLAHRGLLDKSVRIEPDARYPVQHAADHHVIEAERIRNFVAFLAQASTLTPHTAQRSQVLDKAGHLMYASQVSYSRDAMLGSDESDVLVELVRKDEHSGFFGARTTAGGCGGVVAVLCKIGPEVDAALERLMTSYRSATGKIPKLIV